MSIDYAHIPAMPPPPGVTSNFVNPKSRANVFIASSAVCLSLMLPIVIMRLFSRIWINRSFAVDDGQLSLPNHVDFADVYQLLVQLQRYVFYNALAVSLFDIRDR